MQKEKKKYNPTCSFRLLPSEKSLLKEKAKKLGLSLSEYMRESVLSASDTLQKTKIIIEISVDCINQLSRIGNNLNQLTYYVNKKQKAGDLSADLDRAILEELLQVLREILDKITINQ